MSFLDDVVDLVAAEVSHIGLSTDGEAEYSGGSYTHLAPTYGTADGGEADITSTLEFDGGANDGPVTHLIFKRSGSAWVIRPVAEPKNFNSDGRLDVTAALIASDFLT